MQQIGTLRNETDVVVVGGGPAGIAAALAVRQKGFTVTVVDYAWPPIDKTCGEGLMPDSLAALQRLGVEIDPFQIFRFRGIRFLGSGVSVEADFPSGSGFGVRRTTLHRAMFYTPVDMNTWCNQRHNVPYVFPETQQADNFTPPAALVASGFNFGPPVLGRTTVSFASIDLHGRSSYSSAGRP